MLWSGTVVAGRRLVREVRGEDELKRALAAGKGVIAASPHLGAWELAGLELFAAAARIVSMYRLQRQRVG